MSALDRLAHLEAENARLEADNVRLLHDKHRAIAERDRARSVAVNLETDYALLKIEAGAYAAILQAIECGEPAA